MFAWQFAIGCDAKDYVIVTVQLLFRWQPKLGQEPKVELALV